MRKFNDRLLNYPSRRKIKIKTGSEITRASFLVGVIRNNPKTKGMKISLFQVGSRKMKDRWGELRLEFRKRLSRLCGVKGVIHASITRVGGKPSHVRLRHLSCKCTRRRCATGVETWSRLVSLVHFLRFDTILLLFSGVE